MNSDKEIINLTKMLIELLPEKVEENDLFKHADLIHKISSKCELTQAFNDSSVSRENFIKEVREQDSKKERLLNSWNWMIRLLESPYLTYAHKVVLCMPVISKFIKEQDNQGINEHNYIIDRDSSDDSVTVYTKDKKRMVCMFPAPMTDFQIFYCLSLITDAYKAGTKSWVLAGDISNVQGVCL